MSKSEDETRRYLWTGAMSIASEKAGEIIGVVGEVSPLSRPGVVQISLHNRTCPPEQCESHVNFYLSEYAARQLVEQLTRVIHRAEALRALHRTEILRDEALWRPEDLPWQFIDEDADVQDTHTAEG